MSEWKHDALASDLGAHLALTRDRVVFENMQLGPAGSPRPDVYTIPKVYNRFTPLAYEVKISVADFRSDVTSGKWQSYRAYSSAVIFAVPKGLIGKADIPDGCGLMVRNEAGWKTAKAPALQPVDNLPLAAWQKLFFDGLERQDKSRRLEPRRADAWHIRAKTAAMLGKDVAWAIENREAIDEAASRVLEFIRKANPHDSRPARELTWRIRELAQHVGKVMKLWRQMAAMAGVSSSDWPDWSAVRVVEEHLKSLQPGAATEDVAAELDRIAAVVERARQNLVPAVAGAEDAGRRRQDVSAEGALLP